MAPPSASVSEYPDRLELLLPPLPHKVPGLDSWSDSLTTQDSDSSCNPTPQDPDISSSLAAQGSRLSTGPHRILYLPEDNFFTARTPQDFDEIGLSYYGLVTNIKYDWPNKEESFYGGYVGYVDRRLHGSSSERDKWGQFPHMSAYEGFSGIRGISDSSDMATPELSSCSTISPASSTKTPASSTMTTASSAMNIGYGGGEETRSEPSKRRDRHRWPCELCDRSYIRQGDLRRHKRKQHYIGSQTTKHVQQEPEARDNRMAKSLQSTLGKAPLRETSPLPHSKDKAHPSSKYEAKLTDYQGHGNSDEADKARVKPELHRQGSRMSNQCVGSDIYSRAMSSDNYSAFPGNPDMSSKKRHNPDDDTSQCSGDFSSEEGDDSDGECDNVTTWNCSQPDALPSFLPYIRGHEGDTSSPCSDSPDSGSTTSGTTSDTPTSSTSGCTGGNGLQGNGYTSPSSGIGASNNSNHPILGIKDGMGPNFASDPQPLPLICWYSAAGIACTSKHVKMSIEVRHLWNDHAWGKNRKLPNHRLSDACQRCKRLFITQQLLDEHVAPQGPCRALSSVELEELNKEPNRLGISLECKEAVDDLRKSIDKVTKGDHMPAFHDSETMALLKQRVDSNVLLYINGSNTSEKTARSQLWKWYLIFKRLRPDDEVPRNPFISAQRLAGSEERPRADAHRIFMQLLDQKRIEGCLPQFDDDQRNAIGRVFLDTLEMLGANQANERHRSVQTRRNSRKRQRLSPPEDHGPAPGSTDITLAPTTPAPAPAPTPVEFPPSVRDTVNLQHPTFTLPEVQNQLLPQTPSSALQSFMPSADSLWLLQQQQQQEADAHSMFSTGDFGYIDLSTDYGGLSGFGTQDR